MDRSRRTDNRIGDLFGDRPIKLAGHSAGDPIALPAEPAELKAARALSAQMRLKRSRRDKKQVAHLICLSLITMLKHGARR